MTLIDELLPQPHFSTRHSALYNASPPQVMRAVQSIDLADSKLTRLLFTLRGLPTKDVRIDQLSRHGFLPVGASEDQLVFGMIAKPWTRGGELLRVEPVEFAGFREPGYAKIGWSFGVEDNGGGETRLITETRVRCTDERSRRLFTAYWTLVSPFSGLVRRELLRLVSIAVDGPLT